MLALSVLATLFVLDTWRVLTWPAPASKQADARVEITYEEMFREIAPQYGLDWRMLARQAYQESRLDPLAVGRDHDTGLMQIVPSTWREWAPQVGVTDPFDPYSNVLVAAAYLAFLRGYFSEMGYPEDRWMLVAYNWGPHNLRRLLEQGGGWEQVPPKRQNYALAVLEATSDLPPGWGHICDEPVIKTLDMPKEKP
jgi:soluble lytic murein transglycosylase-like protein